MSIKAPCFDCDERFPTCHDTCNKYKAFKKARQQVREKEWAVKELDSYKQYKRGKALGRVATNRR